MSSTPVARAPLTLRYRLEYALLRGVVGLLRPLPPNLASAFGAGLGVGLGFLLTGATRAARKRIAAALPDQPDQEHDRIVRGMWRNLGRVLAEYTQLDKIVAGMQTETGNRYVELVGFEPLQQLATDKKPVIVVTAHCANWEVMPAAAAALGLHITVFHRPLNNPLVEGWLRALRTRLGIVLLAKGHEHGGSRKVIAALRKGTFLGLLVDQAFRGGPRSLFFGQAVRTTSAPASLAAYFDCPIYPMSIVRLGGCRFRITLHPALPLATAPDRDTMLRETTCQIDQTLEALIRQHPEQWLWLHNRWKSWPEYEAIQKG